GYWTLYRFDPRKEQPLTIDSKEPKWDEFNNFILSETRYSQLPKIAGETAYEMFAKTQSDAKRRYTRLVKLSKD
ncbi:MAG: hypothetical protein R3Y57_04935, partial [Erysipelotrichaceae bacterium]